MKKFKIQRMYILLAVLLLLPACAVQNPVALKNADEIVAKPARDISLLSSMLLPTDESSLDTLSYARSSQLINRSAEHANAFTPLSRASNTVNTELSTAWFTTVEGYQNTEQNPKNLISISSSFGKRGRKSHTGIDIRAPKGTDVLAFQGGKVIFAGKNGAYGLTVDIEHKDGKVARYAHMEKIVVKEDEVVVPGSTVGFVGRTGRATGYHLHVEVRSNNRPVDPLNYISKTEQVLKYNNGEPTVQVAQNSIPQKPVAKKTEPAKSENKANSKNSEKDKVSEKPPVHKDKK